jgi:hypothetical protein
MDTPNPELDPKLAASLKSLQRQALRDPQAASRARQAFLEQAAQIKPRVSNLPPNRLEGRKENLLAFWFGLRKEKNPMLNFVLSVVLVLGLMLGAGATTVAAAQAAPPDGALYPLKTWSEDVRLDWVADPQAKLDLTLQFNARRSADLQTALCSGAAVPEPVLARFENQERLTLTLAAGLPVDQTRAALEQIRTQARQQEQAMAQLQLNTPAAQQIRARLQTMLQTQAQIAQQGLENPNWLREQLRLHENNRFRLSTPTVQPPARPTSPTPGGSQGTHTPGQGNGPGAGNSQNPWIEPTYTPCPGNGPGTGTNGNIGPTANPNPGNPTTQPGQGEGGNTQPGDGNGSGGETGNGSGNGNGSKP